MITHVVGFITSKTVAVLLMTNVKTADGVNRTIPVGVWKAGVDIIAKRSPMKSVKTNDRKAVFGCFLNDTLII